MLTQPHSDTSEAISGSVSYQGHLGLKGPSIVGSKDLGPRSQSEKTHMFKIYERVISITFYILYILRKPKMQLTVLKKSILYVVKSDNLYISQVTYMATSLLI